MQLMKRTWFGNNGCVLAHTGIFTETAEVLAVDAEHVLVSDDHIRDRAVGTSIVFIHGKPVLRERGLQTINEERVGLKIKYICILFHLGFFVGLLNCVSGDLGVAVIFGRFPFQSGVESPDVSDVHLGWRSRFIWGQITTYFILLLTLW